MEAKTYKHVARMLDELLSPAEIARQLNITTGEAIQGIFVIIGEGRIRQSDLLFILARKYVSEANFLDGLSGKSPEELRRKLKTMLEIEAIPRDWDLDELVVYVSYRNRRVYVGDMYVFLTELERTLHEQIKLILTREYGEADTGWWRQGVPVGVRRECAAARESDGDFSAHAYCYTTIMDLKDILDMKKALFQSRLPKSIVNMKLLFSELTRLNGIRNQVMHPVREKPPTEEDFAFVRGMHKKLDASLWR